MVVRRLVVGGFLGIGLACAGLPMPASEDAAPTTEAVVPPDVAALLAAEDPEHALAEDARSTRVQELTSFLAGRTDVAEHRDRVIECMGAKVAGCEKTEVAWDKVVADYGARDPVAVEGEAVLVGVKRAYAVSADWPDTIAAWKTAWGDALTVVEVEHGQTTLSLAGTTIDLAPALPEGPAQFGFALLDADTAPTWLGYGPPDALNARVAELTGKCPVAGCSDATPAPQPSEPRRGKSPAPEPEPVAPVPAPAPPPPPPAPPPPPREDLDTPEPATKVKGKVKGGKR